MSKLKEKILKILDEDASAGEFGVHYFDRERLATKIDEVITDYLVNSCSEESPCCI